MNEGDYIRGYRLKREIGRGSYGDVWLAEKQMDFGGASVYYALKFLRNKTGEGIDIDRVIKEIVAWTKASSHANVISIRDSFIEHGKYVIVSDYADGGSLKNRDFSFEEAVKIIEGVLDGIEYLHGIPIIHRDIKPENILLKNGVPCISDFGLAREFDKTQSTGFGGSINYFSPEMAKKELGYEAHERTPLDDLWAIAVTLYQLITGELPFKKMGHIIKCRREPLPTDFPPGLVGFFDRAFHRSRRRRFQSAREMRKALQSVAYPENSYEDKIEELTLRLSDLQSKILDSQNSANLLYKMAAEERIKSQQLTAAKEEIERKSLTEKAKLQGEIGNLQDELKDVRQQLEETTADNARLKKHLRVLRRQFIESPSKIYEAAGLALPPVQLEQAFFDAGNDFLNKKDYDKAIIQFTEAIELNAENATAYYQRGIAYNGRGAACGSTEDYDNAIRDYYQATFLKGTAVKAFRSNPEALYNRNGYRRTFFTFFNGDRELSVEDYKRLLKLHPIFNNAFDKLKKARKARRSEVLKFILKWAALLLAFSGLYISTYKLIRPLASNSASFLRHKFYDLGQIGQIGETIVFAAVIAAGIALSMLLLIALMILLKNVLHPLLSEKVFFTAFSAVGLLFSVFIFYSFFFTNDNSQVGTDRDEKKAYACAIENPGFAQTEENSPPASRSFQLYTLHSTLN